MRHTKRISSPIGELLAIECEGRLTHLRYVDPGDETLEAPVEAGASAIESPLLARLEDQLREYFAGHRRAFDVPLRADGSDFQRQVWEQLMDIPFGKTISYGELARRIGRPTAVRAVGGANNKNPITIVVPCHRVIGSANAMVGYGGGLDRKRALLLLEGAAAAPRQLELRC